MTISGVGLAQETPAASDTPLEPGFSDSVEVNLVNIDVYVRDKKGRPVTGLTAADFVVREDGEDREITNFSVLTEPVFRSVVSSTDPTGAPVAVPTPAEPAPEIRPTWLVLYIDQENLQPLDRTRALRRVREFVRDSVIPPVQVMVVANEGSLQVKQPFTGDARQVVSVLRGLGLYSGSWMDRESTRVDLVDRMRDAKEDAKHSRGNNPRSSNARGNRQLFQEVLSYAREEAFTLSHSMQQLRQTIDMLSGLDGRKVLIYVSNGLPMTPGLGLMHEYATTFHDNSILTYRGQFEKQAQYRSLASSAASQEVVFHTIDAGGLDVNLGGGADSAYSSDPTASQVGSSNYQGSLRYLAHRTGGIAVVNTNDVSKGLARVRDDLYTYYSIGFPVRGAGGDTIHTVDVDIPGRQDLDIRHRGRFVRKSLETRVQDQVVSALLLGIDHNPMGVIVDRMEPRSVSKEHWMVPVRVSVPVDRLALLPVEDRRVGHVLLIAGARSANGRQSDIQREAHEIVVPADADDGDERWAIERQFLMEEGNHRIVVGLLDQITHKASYATLVVSLP